MAKRGRAGEMAGKVLAAVQQIARIERPERFGTEALEAIFDVVPFDIGSYNEVDPVAGRVEFSAWPPGASIAPGAGSAFARLVQQNPVLQYEQRTGDGSPRRISDFIGCDELHGLELYQEVYGPLGVEYQVAFTLVVKLPLVIALALNRSAADFSDEELDVLGMLRPHLAQAYRNLQAVAALEEVDEVLARAGQAVVVLGSAGGVTASSWAVSAMARHFGEPAVTALPAAVARWAEEERSAVFGDGAARIHRPLQSVVDGCELTLRYLPPAGARRAVIVIEEREPRQPDVELARLGLTRREGEILRLLAEGHPAASIAALLEVRRTTVSKHLEHIYRKLGVASRTAAVAAAADAVFSRR